MEAHGVEAHGVEAHGVEPHRVEARRVEAHRDGAHRLAGRVGIAAAIAVGVLLASSGVATAAVETGRQAAAPRAAEPSKEGMKTQGTSPDGWLDVVDGGGVAGGWTCDPDDFSQPLHVHFYVDGPAGSGTFIGAAYADLTREPAVGDLCGGWRNHGYRWALPGWLWDGHWHRLYVHAINIGPGDHVLLQGSGIWFRLGGSNPYGWLDLVDEDGVVHGWTCDPDDFSQPLYVHFYVDGSFVGDVHANRTREPAVGDACGGARNHGYSFPLPESVRDGQWRTLSVWAINIGGGTNVQLSGSPSGFRLDPSLEPQAFDWGEWGIATDPSQEAEDPTSPGDRSDVSREEAHAPGRLEVEPAGEAAVGALPPELDADSAGEVESDAAAELPLAEPPAQPASASAGPETASPELEPASPQEAEPPAMEEEKTGAPESDLDRSEGVTSTRCEWHSFSATFRQTRHGWHVVTYKGYFRVCFVPNDRITSVADVHGDASWICSWCGWRWLGNANGYPNYTNFGSRLVLRYRGTAQFCPPQFWCIGTRQPWVEITFFPNGTKKQVIGVG